MQQQLIFEQYINRYHTTKGLCVQNHEISDLVPEIEIQDHQTVDIYIMNHPFSLLFCNILIHDGYIVLPTGNSYLRISRGDHLQISLQNRIAKFSLFVENNEVQIVQFQVEEDNLQNTLKLTGHFIVLVNAEQNFYSFTDVLGQRTYESGLIERWVGFQIPPISQQLSSGVQLFTTLQTLIMSPFAVNETGLCAAFQQYGKDGLIQYHQNQLHLGYLFLLQLSLKQIMCLCSFIIDNINSDLLQTGVCAQLFRVLIRYGCEKEFDCKELLTQLLVSKVTQEANNRFDGQFPKSRVQKLILYYMDCYALAYTSNEFDVISNLKTMYCDSDTYLAFVVQYVFSALFLEEEAVDFLLLYCKSNIEIFQRHDYNGLYFLLKTALQNEEWKETVKQRVQLKVDQQNISALDRKLVCLYFLLTDEFVIADHPRMVHYALRHLREPVYIIFCVHFLSQFEPSIQNGILFTAFQFQQQVYNIKQYNKNLEGMRIFTAQSGFSFDVLNYKERVMVFDLEVDVDYTKEFTAEQLNFVMHCQQDLGIPHLEAPALREKKHENVPEDEADYDDQCDACCICYCKLEENSVVQLGCSHKLCATCVSKTALKCPICRARVSQFMYQGSVFQEFQEIEEEENEQEYS